jgi:hypothetical protein
LGNPHSDIVNSRKILKTKMLRKHEKYIAYILLILDYIGVVLTYLISAPAAPILAQFVLGEQMQIFSCGKIAGELYEYYHR